MFQLSGVSHIGHVLTLNQINKQIVLFNNIDKFINN